MNVLLECISQINYFRAIYLSRLSVLKCYFKNKCILFNQPVLYFGRIRKKGKIYRSFYNFTVSEFGRDVKGDITGDIADLLQT